MNAEERRDILALLDFERRTVLYPGVTRHREGEVVRDVSADGKSGEVVYSSCAEGEVDQIIERQIQTARSERYELEWKVYGHDRPTCLGKCLAAARFEAGEREAFLVFFASDEALDRFGVCRHDIRRVTGSEGLEDYRVIREEVRGRSCDTEIERYKFLLEHHPDTMSVYVAYVGDEPAACGRVYFHQSSRFAGLYGGNTRARFRRRGLFTEIVAVRLREALGRGIVNVCVDALPTSEPILKQHGFQNVTYTQPFRLSA